MKKLLLFAGLCSIFNVNAQVIFCPAGAEWNFNFVDNNLSPVQAFTNEKISYVRDSIIGSDTTKVLKHRRFFKLFNSSSVGLTLLKIKGDTVFVRSQFTQHLWKTLYNFATPVGQTWTCSIGSDNYSTRVDSIRYVSINNTSLKRLYVTHLYAHQPSSGYQSIITERFGSDEYLFYFDGNISDGDYVSAFLCYKDNTFGSKQFTSKPCDYQNLAGVKELKSETWIVYPNPVQNILIVENTFAFSPGSRICIKDLLGKEVLNTSISNGRQVELRLEGLEKGLYFIQLSDKGKVMATERFVKE